MPKIKKVDLKSKILLDPADLRKGLPKNKVPELFNEGLILSLKSQKAPPAKLSYEGNLKLRVKYEAQVLQLKNRYVEVKCIDDYGDKWIGTLFGVTVHGVGGSGIIRGCKVVKIVDETIEVEYINEGGNPIWKKIEQKVKDILDEA